MHHGTFWGGRSACSQGFEASPGSTSNAVRGQLSCAALSLPLRSLMAGTACTELRRNGRSFHSQAIPENGRSFHSQAVPETPCVARWAVQHKVPTSRASWQVQLVPDLVRGKVGCAGPQGHRKPLRTKSQAQCIHGYVRIRAVPETQCVARWAVQAPRCTMGASGPKVRLAETAADGARPLDQQGPPAACCLGLRLGLSGLQGLGNTVKQPT